MTKAEIAYELTKTAIENRTLFFINRSNLSNQASVEANAINAKQISDFYNNIFDEIKTKAD